MTYVLAATLYAATAARGPMPGDWGDFVAAAGVLGIAHPTGYPTYLQLIGLPLLVFTRAWAAAATNCANALLVAFAPAALAAWTAAETRRFLGNVRLGAAFAVGVGALAAVSPAFWKEARSVEVYGAAAAVTLGALLILNYVPPADDRRGLAAAFLGGLAVGIHLTAATYIVAFLTIHYISRRIPFRFALVTAAVFLVGASVTLYIPLRTVVAPPLTWSWGGGTADVRTFVIHTTGKQFSYNFRLPTASIAAWRLGELGETLARNAGFFLLLAPFGLFVIGWRSKALLFQILGALTLNAGYLLFYDIPDLASYHVTFLALTFVCAAVGAARLFALWGEKGQAAVSLVVAGAAAAGGVTNLRAVGADVAFLQYYERLIFVPVGPNGIFTSGTTTSNFYYWYRQFVMLQRRDVTLFNINDERYDIDKLAVMMWRELGARPVFCDYFFLEQTQERVKFASRGRPSGFILEISPAPTSPNDVWEKDGEVLTRCAETLRGHASLRQGENPALSIALATWEHRAAFHELRGELNAAEIFHRHAAALAPWSSMPLINLASHYFDRGDYTRARRAAGAALARGQEKNLRYMAYAYLAMAAQAEGDLATAEEAAKKAVALKPHDPKTRHLLAVIYGARGKKDLAQEELERALARGYESPEMVLLLAQLYQEEGRNAEALELLARNARKYNDPLVMNSYALALIKTGRYAEAKSVLLSAAAMAPDSREIQANLARLEEMGW